jgi:hypothetical protein
VTLRSSGLDQCGRYRSPQVSVANTPGPGCTVCPMAPPLRAAAIGPVPSTKACARNAGVLTMRPCWARRQSGNAGASVWLRRPWQESGGASLSELARRKGGHGTTALNTGAAIASGESDACLTPDPTWASRCLQVSWPLPAKRCGRSAATCACGHPPPTTPTTTAQLTQGGTALEQFAG